MRRILSVFLIVGFVLCFSGCAEQKALDEYLKQLKGYADEVTDVADEAVDKISGLITEAEKDTPPKLAEGDQIVDATRKGAETAAPFLPFPFNVLIGLVPFGVAWFRAKNRADRRTAEEALLIAGLQTLKEENPDAFEKFVEYRDMAAKGLATAKQTAELLEGISEIRAKYAT